MRVLITGVNGFIGSRLTHELVARGHEVSGIGRNATTPVEGVRYVRGDVTDPSVFSAVGAVDAIVHLAARTAHNDIVRHARETLEENWRSTKNALEHAGENGLFIYASTGKVYGDAATLPIEEDHPCRPRNILGKSKYITERLVDFYAALWPNGTYRVARIFNVYGPMQRESFLVPTILKQIGAGKDRIQLGDIHARRDYVYVDDVIEALTTLVEREKAPGVAHYNVATGVASSASDIVQQLAALLNRELSVEGDATRHRLDEGDVEYASYASLAAIGWAPKHTLKEGLAATLAGAHVS